MHLFPSPHFRCRLLFEVSFLIVSAHLLSCQTPLDPVDKTSDPIEFESVWQYCRAWSIYQDSSIYDSVSHPVIPRNPFAFSNPAAIMDSIHDTLKGNDYTCYGNQYFPPDGFDTFYDWSAASSGPTPSVASASASPTLPYSGTVTLDTLTNSTALLTIYTFEAAIDGQVYSDFLYFVQSLSRFNNIIIDLRDNLGGYIDEAQNIIGSMVPNGTAYILARQRDYDSISNKYVTLDWHNWYIAQSPGPLISSKHYAVIMNAWTASAAELTVSGLYEGQKKEWKSIGDSAWLLGSRSYGKGIGQVLFERRESCYNSFTGVDTFYNTNGDSMEVVPYFTNDFLDLKITFLQLQGVSPRIGFYHRVGIAPDVVPVAITQQVDSLLPITTTDTSISADSVSAYWRPICYGVKLFETGVNIDSLVQTSVTTLGKITAFSLHKRAVQGRRNISQVVEKVIRTSKILLLK